VIEIDHRVIILRETTRDKESVRRQRSDTSDLNIPSNQGEPASFVARSLGIIDKVSAFLFAVCAAETRRVCRLDRFHRRYAPLASAPPKGRSTWLATIVPRRMPVIADRRGERSNKRRRAVPIPA
jgi:hypothetical protein